MMTKNILLSPISEKTTKLFQEDLIDLKQLKMKNAKKEPLSSLNLIDEFSNLVMKFGVNRMKMNSFDFLNLFLGSI